MTIQNAARSVARLEAEIEALEKEALGAPVEAEKGGEEEEVIETPTEPVAPTEEAVETPTEPVVTETDEGNFKKRYADLRRHNQKVSDDLKAAQAALEELKATKSSGGLPSAEEAEAWAKENPKAAAIIRALAARETSSSSEDLTAIKEKLYRTEQEARIHKAYPDFEDITGQDAFHDWAENQPESIQRLVYSNTADDVIWAIGQYKKDTPVSPTNPKKEAAKAVSSKATSAEPRGEGKGRFTESQVSKMSMSEYEKHEVAIQTAIKDGTFVYDLSGAAR